MKKFIIIFALLLITGHISAQEAQSQTEVINVNEVMLQGSEVQLHIKVPNIKIDSLPETKKSIRLVHLGSTFPLEPLYLIDGMLANADFFKKIRPDNIISISILKDAPGTYFCNRPNNGVVVVKTKNGLTKKEKRKLKRAQKEKDRTQTN